jgi:hypothetical protein
MRIIKYIIQTQKSVKIIFKIENLKKWHLNKIIKNYILPRIKNKIKNYNH